MFHVKVWLVTMIGLTNSLSTYNFSEMIQKNGDESLVKAVNSHMLSHPGAQQRISGGLTQTPCEESMSNKLRMEY